MLLIPFPLDLKTNLLKDVKIETPPGENFTVTYVCEIALTKNWKYYLGTFATE